jgi:hypothetical protein
MEPSAISHPHKDPLFLVIEESGVELEDDFLILVVPKLEQIRYHASHKPQESC